MRILHSWKRAALSGSEELFATGRSEMQTPEVHQAAQQARHSTGTCIDEDLPQLAMV